MVNYQAELTQLGLVLIDKKTRNELLCIEYKKAIETKCLTGFFKLVASFNGLYLYLTHLHVFS